MTPTTMTEDELLTGLTDAMTLSGWWWMHIRRSDRALVQGMQGFPDIFAVHPIRKIGLAWELKSAKGQPTYEQHAWLNALALVLDGCPNVWDGRIVRPSDYDDALAFVLRGTWGA